MPQRRAHFERRPDRIGAPGAGARVPSFGWGLLAVVAIGTGCSARQAAPPPLPPVRNETQPAEVVGARREVEESLAKRRTGVAALRGRGTLLVASPEWDGATRVQAVVLARRPADLRIRGYTPLSTAFDCLTSADRFLLHLPDPGEAWTGPAEQLGPATGLPLVPADLVAALFGDPFDAGDSLAIRSVAADRIEAEWWLPDGSRVEAQFHRHPTRPQRFRLWRGAEVRVELEYGDYLLEPQGWWPRRYDLSWPADESYFRLQLVAVELNPSFTPESFTLEPPDGTQWLRVRATDGRADAGADAGGEP